MQYQEVIHKYHIRDTPSKQTIDKMLKGINDNIKSGVYACNAYINQEEEKKYSKKNKKEKKDKKHKKDHLVKF